MPFPARARETDFAAFCRCACFDSGLLLFWTEEETILQLCTVQKPSLGPHEPQHCFRLTGRISLATTVHNPRRGGVLITQCLFTRMGIVATLPLYCIFDSCIFHLFSEAARGTEVNSFHVLCYQQYGMVFY